MSFAKQNARHIKNLSSTTLNESMTKLSNDIQQPNFAGIVSQNSTPSQSQLNTLKKAIGSNAGSAIQPKKQKLSPKQMNIYGSETRVVQTNQQYYNSATSSVPAGSIKASRQESYGSAISEETPHSYNRTKNGFGQRCALEEEDLNTLNQSDRRGDSSSSAPSGIANAQTKLYQQEQFKYQGRPGTSEQMRTVGIGFQNQQNNGTQFFQKSITPENPASRNFQITKINGGQQSHQVQQVQKNSSSCSPDSKKQQSPILSFVIASNNSNSNSKQYNKQGYNSSISVDTKNHNINPQLSVITPGSSGLAKKHSSEYVHPQKLVQQHNQQSPLKFVRAGVVETKPQRQSANTSQKEFQAYQQAQGYLLTEEPRVRIAPTQGDRGPLVGSQYSEKNQYQSQVVTQELQQLIAGQIVGNKSSEERGITPLKSKDAARKEAFVRMSTNQTQNLSTPFHRAASSMSNIKTDTGGMVQQINKEPSRSIQIPSSNNSGMRRTPSNPKQCMLNFSMNSGPTNGIYYLSSGANSTTANNNLLNQTYANHNMNASGTSSTSQNQLSNLQQFQPVIPLQQQQQYQYQTNQYQQPSNQIQGHQNIQLQQQIQQFNQKGISQQSTSSSQNANQQTHLKQNQKSYKSSELSFEQMRQIQLQQSGENMKIDGLAHSSGARSRSPLKKESAKGGQDYSESFLTTYVKNVVIQKQQSSLKDLVMYWEKVGENHQLINSTSPKNNLIQASTKDSISQQFQMKLSENKLNDFLKGVKQLAEYDNQLEPIVNMIMKFSSLYFQNIPKLLQDSDKLKEQQSQQIEDLQKKLEESDQSNNKLKKDLSRNEQQINSLNQQLTTQQQQLQQLQIQLQQQQQVQQLQMQQLQQQQLINSTAKNQQNSPTVNLIDPSLQEQLLIEFRHLQVLAEEQQKEIEQYKEREVQIKELLVEFSNKGLIRINANGDAFIRQMNNINNNKGGDSDDNNSDRREEYRLCKQNITELLREQEGNISLYGEQLADNSRISDSEESSFGFLGKLTLREEDYHELSFDSPTKKMDTKLKEKLKLNMAQVEETQKLIEEQQAIEDQKEKEIMQQQIQKQQELKKQNKEVAKLQKTQLKSQSFHQKQPQMQQQGKQLSLPQNVNVQIQSNQNSMRSSNSIEK